MMMSVLLAVNCPKMELRLTKCFVLSFTDIKKPAGCGLKIIMHTMTLPGHSICPGNVEMLPGVSGRFNLRIFQHAADRNNQDDQHRGTDQ